MCSRCRDSTNATLSFARAERRLRRMRASCALMKKNYLNYKFVRRMVLYCVCKVRRQKRYKKGSYVLLKLSSKTTAIIIFVLSNDAHEIPGDVPDVVHVCGFHFRDNLVQCRWIFDL